MVLKDEKALHHRMPRMYQNLSKRSLGQMNVCVHFHRMVLGYKLKPFHILLKALKDIALTRNICVNVSKLLQYLIVVPVGLFRARSN